MSKSRLRALKQTFLARYGRLPLKASPDQPSEQHTLKRAWRQYVESGR
jgi:hypothetical protein